MADRSLAHLLASTSIYDDSYHVPFAVILTESSQTKKKIQGLVPVEQLQFTLLI